MRIAWQHGNRPAAGSAPRAARAASAPPHLTAQRMSAASLLDLQRTAGNRAAASLFGHAALAVQRTVAAVERELARRFSNPDDPELLRRRDRLAALFSLLSDADAMEVASRLLEPVGSDPLAAGIQRLARSSRRRLLGILFPRLGHQNAETLHAALTGTSGNRLRSRLAQLVPDQAHRRALLSSLEVKFAAAHRAPAGEPLWVNLDTANFRTSGGLSSDNNCTVAADYGTLGPDTASGRNMMELRGDVAGHQAGTEYDFKRTIELATWSAASPTDTWRLLRSLPAGSPDDKHDDDEDRTPDGGHLYVVDSPGPYFDNPAFGHRDAKHYVYVANFVEWVEAKTGSGGWQKVSDDFSWYSVSTLEKVNGSWRRDGNGANDIGAGTYPMLSPDGQVP